MLSAEEARKQQHELNTSEEKKQLEDVEKAITKDIKKGYTYYYGKLKDTVDSELRRLGYKIQFISDQRDGDLTTIKW